MKYYVLLLLLVVVSCQFSDRSAALDVTPRIDLQSLFEKHRVHDLLIQRNFSLSFDTLGAILAHQATPDSTRALAQFNFAKRTYYHGKWQESIPLFEKARAFYKRIHGASAPTVAHTYAWQALPYFKLDQCDSIRLMVDQALEQAEKDTAVYPPLIRHDIYNSLGHYYKCVEDYENMKAAHRKALQILQPYRRQYASETTWTLQQLASAYYYAQDFWTAIDYYELALPELTRLYAHVIGEGFTSTVHNNLGLCYNAVGEYDRAISHLRQAIDHNLKFATLENCHPGVAANFKNIAASNEAIGDLVRAKNQLEIALQILANRSQDQTVRAGQIRTGLAGVLYKMKAYDEAVVATEEAMQIEAENGRDASIQTAAPLYQWLGKIHLALNDTAAMKRAFSKANAIFENGLPKTQSRWIDHHLQVAEANMDFHRYQHGLHVLAAMQPHLQSANTIQEATWTLQAARGHLGLSHMKEAQQWLKKTTGLLNYRLDDPHRLDNRYPIEFLIEYLDAVASWHIRQYDLTHRSHDLKRAIQYLEDAANYLFRQRSLLQNSTFINHRLTGLQEKLIRLYKRENQPDSRELIFRQMEQSKAVRLISMVKSNRIQKDEHIPASMAAKIDDLESKKRFYSVQLQTMPEKRRVFLPKFEEADLSLEKLKKIVHDSFPTYHRFRFEHQTIGLERVQKKLTTDQVLLEYFWGEEEVWGAMLSSDTLEIRVLGKTPVVQAEVNSFLEALQESRKESAEANRFMESYAATAATLYRKLVAPLLPHLKANRKRILIIPDGPLGALPFSALLTATPADLRKQYDFPYILNEWTLSLAYSATFHFDWTVKSESRPTLSYLGFAPFANVDKVIAETLGDTERSDFEGLPYSGKEVDQGRNLFKGESYLGKSATKSVFLEKASHAALLHCATHAIGNAENGELSYLLFHSSKENHSGEQLYAQEIFDLNLQARLAILSTCQSARGRYAHGEGAVSLAYAFSAAGAESVCSTYWTLNDEASYKVLSAFFEHLLQGNPKDEALRAAQLQFLRSSPRNAHPYYWAVFNLFGDTDQLSF